MPQCSFGVLFSGHFPFQRQLSGAVLAEQLGFDSCWLGEDYFYHGAIATATAIAERTSRLTIGLGVLSPLARHPALTAMEVATLDEIAEGRVVLGMGYGVPTWMDQMHLGVRSPLTAMREGVDLCRRLLAGDSVTYQGACFSLDRVQLGFTPPRASIPTFLGVEGPKALQLSGEIADGTIISILAGPRYLWFARENIAHGCARSGRPAERHKLVVYVVFSMHDDGAVARDAVRRTIAEYVGAGGEPKPLVSLGGIPDDLVREMGRRYRAGEIPIDLVDDTVMDQLAVAGTPDECEAAIRRLIEAGADTIVFFPFPSDSVERQLEQISSRLLPRLTA
jgi:alkanesulfonate monooxygenase SsuD/methylene tetrahydromethanopterin reductase-like flavin-dependent oxidoreductase (luciferase family)